MMKAFFNGLFAIAIGCLPIWLLGGHLVDSALLAYSGRSTVGYVANYQPQRCGRSRRQFTCHFHSVNVDGQSIRFDLGQQYSVGTFVNVTYLPNNPKIAKLGTLSGRPIDYLKSQFGIVEAIGLAVGVSFIWVGIAWWRSMFRAGDIPQ